MSDFDYYTASFYVFSTFAAVAVGYLMGYVAEPQQRRKNSPHRADSPESREDTAHADLEEILQYGESERASAGLRGHPNSSPNMDLRGNVAGSRQRTKARFRSDGSLEGQGNPKRAPLTKSAGMRPDNTRSSLPAKPAPGHHPQYVLTKTNRPSVLVHKGRLRSSLPIGRRTPAATLKAVGENTQVQGDEAVGQDDVDMIDIDMLPSPAENQDRVIVVVFKLPVNVSKDENGKWVVSWNDCRDHIANFRQLKNKDVTWVGWPNVDVPPSEWEELEIALEKHKCVPVQLRKELRDRMYKGFCKQVLWPLFHYQISRSTDAIGENYDEFWQAYSSVNVIFAKKALIVTENEPNALIWFHNYHCLLAPAFMRKINPQAKIGLFIHTVFPTSEVFRCLPHRTNIIRGITSADLIGFQTYDYARHFISSAKRLLHLDFETQEGGSLGVECNGRKLELQVCHVGVASSTFAEMAAKPEIQKRAQELREKYKGRRIILGIDDLDVVKGTLLKIQAYKRFLEQHREWKKEIVIIQVLKPTSKNTENDKCRADVIDAIDNLKMSLGGDILDVQETSDLTVEDMVVLYVAADVAIFSTFWDGFNTMPHEFTAAQSHKEEPGVLIVSEFMGCSRSLSGVLRVNPWKLTEVAQAMHTALVMGTREKEVAHKRRHKYVMNYDFCKWAEGFLGDLKKHVNLVGGEVCVTLGWGSNVRLIYLPKDYMSLKEHESRFVSAYRRAKKRLLVFDYGGTLMDQESSFSSFCTRSRRVALGFVSKEVKTYLSELSMDPSSMVCVISGHEKKKLAEAFEGLPNMCLFAEKGAHIRWPGASNWVTNLAAGHNLEWKEVALKLLKTYRRKTDGSDIVNKETAVVWVYNNTDPEFGEMQAIEVERYLNRVMKEYNVNVRRYDHTRIIEVLPRNCNKYESTIKIIKQFKEQLLIPNNVKPSEVFMMGCGNDRSDERMFEALEQVGMAWCPASHFTCSVGMKPSNAKYYVTDQSMVVEMLRILSTCRSRSRKLDVGSNPWSNAMTNANSVVDSALSQLRMGGLKKTSSGKQAKSMKSGSYTNLASMG